MLNKLITEIKDLNIIIHADCTNVIPYLPENSIDLLFTDPPQYRMLNNDILFTTRKNIIRKVEFDQFIDYDDFLRFTEEWIGLISTKLKENSSICIWFAENYILDLRFMCARWGLKHKDTLYWHKTNPAPKVRKTGFISSVETLVYFTKGKPTFNFLSQNEMHDFIETPICMGNERIKDKERNTLHPTQKPLKAILRFIEITSNRNDLVVDPFAGVATTNIACETLGRRCISIEKEKKYYLAGRKRLNIKYHKKGKSSLSQYLW